MVTPVKKNVAWQHQSGAALVVALILLVALSLMAISSMNTASLDLIMAGNEQYRSRAFAIAEAGIERAFKGGTLNSAIDTPAVNGTGLGNDTYSYTISRTNGGIPESAPPEYSLAGSQYKSIYFRIASTGTSERGTTTTNVQELFRIVESPDESSYDANCGTAGLDSTTSTC